MALVCEQDGPARFYAESFAPWCERSRWALDHHRIEYREIGQLPVFAEFSLRFAARRVAGPVTVPLLVSGKTVLMDSDAIARHAERIGKGRSLFAQTNEAAQVQWMRASEVLMTAGRALLLTRMLADRHALAEQLPRVVPTALRPLLVWMATAAVEHLMRKYAVRNQRVEQHEALARSVLLQLRRGLADGPEHLLSGRLTYSDITMAAALQFVQPVADRYIALGPATRGVWTHPTFANEHGDLLAWRDRLYERHRHRVMALAAPD